MTRELKLALIVGFSLVLVVTVLISDHLSRARRTELAADIPREPAMVPAAPPVTQIPDAVISGADEQTAPGELISGEADVLAPAAGSEPVTTIDMGSRVVEPGHDTRFAGADGDLIREILERGGEIVNGEIRLPPAARAESRMFLPAPQPIISQTPVGLIPAASVEPERTHTVASGESAFKIAKKYYGDGMVWRKLAAHNKDRIGAEGQVRAGVKLTIPPADAVLGKAGAARLAATQLVATQAAPKPEPIVAPGAAATRPEVNRSAKPATYTVRKGDTLGSIAQRELGTVKRSRELLDLNKSVIKDPNRVPQGAVLRLPTA